MVWWSSGRREQLQLTEHVCFALYVRSLFKSYVTLFWSLFGLTQLSTVREGDMQAFTKVIGEYLLMVYHAMAVIVLINMLIAMMSNSFQEIEVTTIDIITTEPPPSVSKFLGHIPVSSSSLSSSYVMWRFSQPILSLTACANAS